MSNREIFQTILVVWSVCYVYAFIVGMFRLAKRQRQKAPFFARLAICLGSSLLGPIFVVLDFVDLIRYNLRKVMAAFFFAISFITNMVMDMIIKMFILLFGLVFVFTPARKR